MALSFLPRRPAALSVGSGILTGILVLAWAAYKGVAVLGGLNLGLVALGANAAVVGLGETLRRMSPSGPRASFHDRGA